MAIPPDVQAAFEELLEARKYAFHRRERLYGVRSLISGILVLTIWPFFDWIVSQRQDSIWTTPSRGPTVVEFFTSPGFYNALVPVALFVVLLWYLESTSKRFKALLVDARIEFKRAGFSPLGIAPWALLGGLLGVGLIWFFLVWRSPRVLEPDFGLLFGFIIIFSAGLVHVLQGFRCVRQADIWIGIFLASAGCLLLLVRAPGELALFIAFGGTGAALSLRGLLQILIPPRGLPA